MIVTLPLPNQIVDGQLADAGPVMNNYNYIATQVNANAMPLTGPFYGGGFQDVNFSNTAYGTQALISNASGTDNSGFGSHALSALTQSSGNTAVGSGALQVFNGAPFIITGNVAVGVFALSSLTTGTDNTAVGRFALQNGSICSQQVAVGSGAGTAIISGLNTCVGFQAMQNFQGAAGATAIGYQAMQNVPAGGSAQSTAVGAGAMISAGAGNFNCTAIGANTLPNVNGTNNTALGFNAGSGISTGSSNVFVGDNTGTNVGVNSNNTCVGSHSLLGAVNRCTAIGQRAAGNSGGADDITAVGNTALQNGASAGLTAVGSGALASATTTPNCVAVGFNALTLLSNVNGNTTAVGHSAGAQLTSGFNNVIVGNNALDVATGTSNCIAVGAFTLHAATAGSGNDIAIGTSALQSLTTGTANVAIGNAAGFSGTAVLTGDHLTLIGDSAQCNASNYTNSVGLGNAAIVTASNTIVLGNASIGFIRCQVQTINTLSDARHKKEVEDLDLGLGFVELLRPVSYKLKGQEVKHYGFIAQEVQAALDAVHSPDLPLTERTIADGDPLSLLCRENNEERSYLLGYSELFAVLVNAIQELAAQVGELRSLAG